MCLRGDTPWYCAADNVMYVSAPFYDSLMWRLNTGFVTVGLERNTTKSTEGQNDS